VVGGGGRLWQGAIAERVSRRAFRTGEELRGVLVRGGLAFQGFVLPACGGRARSVCLKKRAQPTNALTLRSQNVDPPPGRRCQPAIAADGVVMGAAHLNGGQPHFEWHCRQSRRRGPDRHHQDCLVAGARKLDVDGSYPQRECRGRAWWRSTRPKNFRFRATTLFRSVKFR